MIKRGRRADCRPLSAPVKVQEAVQQLPWLHCSWQGGLGPFWGCCPPPPHPQRPLPWTPLRVCSADLQALGVKACRRKWIVCFWTLRLPTEKRLTTSPLLLCLPSSQIPAKSQNCETAGPPCSFLTPVTWKLAHWRQFFPAFSQVPENPPSACLCCIRLSRRKYASLNKTRQAPYLTTWTLAGLRRAHQPALGLPGVLTLHPCPSKPGPALWGSGSLQPVPRHVISLLQDVCVLICERTM